MTVYNIEAMRRLSADIRIQTILALTEAGYGHIGGSMSIADVLGVLYGGMMRIRPEEPEWEERDWLIMSKGHCGPALYAALGLRGYFPITDMKHINQGGTNLPSHCDWLKTTGIEMTTGSLGQGMSSAEGIAWGNALKGLDSYTYCIIGDGECQEGEVWEAAELAVQLRLSHFIVLLDNNKIQLDGPVAAVRTGQDLERKFAAFGWHTSRVAGYDAQDIVRGIEEAKAEKERPSLVLLDTLKGLGADFAEAVAFNHYMALNWEMANKAIAEIERRYASGTYPRGDVRW